MLAVQLCAVVHTSAAVGKVPAAHNLCLCACQRATACRAVWQLGSVTEKCANILSAAVKDPHFSKTR